MASKKGPDVQISSVDASRADQSMNDREDVPLTTFSNDIINSPPPEPLRKQGGTTWRNKFARQNSDYHDLPHTEPPYIDGQNAKYDGYQTHRIHSGQNFRFSRKISGLGQHLRGDKITHVHLPKTISPWFHEKDPHPNGREGSTVRTFNPNLQQRRVFLHCLWQWLLTLFIVAAMGLLLWGFSRYDHLTKRKKYTFNAGITLLSLCAGLAVVTGFRCFAKLLSWRLLAANYWNLQDFELIMECDSQTDVLKLFWAARKHGRWYYLTGIQWLCILSLACVIGLQIVIGMLGLTYSVGPSPDGTTVDVPGQVAIVDLGPIYQDRINPVTNFPDQAGAANFFGNSGQDSIVYVAPYEGGNEGSDSVYETVDNYDVSTTTPGTWFYQFVNSNYNASGSQIISSSSSRTVSAQVDCVQLEIHSGGYAISESANTLSYTDTRGLRQSIDNVQGIANLTSTYIANATQANSTENFCGSRCTNILALMTGGLLLDGTITAPLLFSCNSTLSNVSHPDTCPNAGSCSIADEQARIWAGSVAWTGVVTPDDDLQYHTYPPGSPFSWDGYSTKWYTNASWVASHIGQFIAQGFSALDQNGAYTIYNGSTPVIADTLAMEWNYTIPILLTIPGVQFIALLLVTLYSRGAIIKDSSPLANARLLRPIVERLGDHGCMLTGDEIAEQLGNFKIIYGYRNPEEEDSTSYDGAGTQGKTWHSGIIFEEEGIQAAHMEGRDWKSTMPARRYD